MPTSSTIAASCWPFEYIFNVNVKYVNLCKRIRDTSIRRTRTAIPVGTGIGSVIAALQMQPTL